MCPIIDGGSATGLPEPSPALGDVTGEILILAARQLQDETGQTWNALDVLLPYLNLGIVEIINLKPDAYTETTPITLDAGARQDVPSGTFAILDIVGNIGADGVTPGRTIRVLSKERLDAILPGWPLFTPTAPMTTPAAPTGTPAITGGSMADGTYYYVITAINQYGETVKGTQSAAKTITGGGGNGSVPLTWTAVAGATSYKVYRTTASGIYTTPCYIANPSTNSYTDTAASPSAGAPPTGDSSGSGVSFGCIDDRNPKVFYVFPPPAAPGIQIIQAVLSTKPANMDAIDDAFPLDESYKPACVDYIVFRALAESTTIPNAQAKAGAFWNKFLQDLGLKTNVEKQNEAKGQ